MWGESKEGEEGCRNSAPEAANTRQIYRYLGASRVQGEGNRS